MDRHELVPIRLRMGANAAQGCAAIFDDASHCKCERSKTPFLRSESITGRNARLWTDTN